MNLPGMTESEVLEMKKMDANTSDTTGHQEDSNNTSDAGDAPLSESALNEMEKMQNKTIKQTYRRICSGCR